MAYDDSVLQLLVDSVLYAHRGSRLREHERKKAMEADLAMAIEEYGRLKKQAESK